MLLGRARERTRPSAQACTPVKEGTISASDQELISGLLAGAEAAGVRSDVVAQWREVAQAGDKVPGSVVKAMQDSCSAAG